MVLTTVPTGCPIPTLTFLNLAGGIHILLSSGTFTSFTLHRRCHSAACVCCVCVRAPVCAQGAEVCAVCRASTCSFSPKADSSLYITQTHPQVLASFLVCLFSFPSVWQQKVSRRWSGLKKRCITDRLTW